MKYDYVAILLGVVCMGVGCKTETRAPVESAAPKPVTTYPAMGKLERLDPQFDALIPPTATIERLAEGYDWSEGPVWIRAVSYRYRFTTREQFRRERARWTRDRRRVVLGPLRLRG